MNASSMCLHRTIGTERQIVTVTIDNPQDYTPSQNYAVCLNAARDLKNVVGVSSQELFTVDNFTLGYAYGSTASFYPICDILCTFKTDNRSKYFTIPLENVDPKYSDQDLYGNIHRTINAAVASATSDSYANWVLVSCNIRLTVEAYGENQEE